MDEGRLAVVIRREEQQRKFVYMMNDIMRTKLGLYSNYLDRAEYESNNRLVKDCSQVKRSIVRQKVLRQCLEMRKRQITAQDPITPFGRYGGKPLWAMSRDIERAIADNHPKLRRMRQVAEAMRQSLETGAILDEETMSRRVKALFQLKQTQKQRERSPERGQDAFRGPGLQRRRNMIKPPSWAETPSSTDPQASLPTQTSEPTSTDAGQESGQPQHDSEDVQEELTDGQNPPKTNRPEKELPDAEHPELTDALGVTDKVSLATDSKGKLQRIKTNRSDSGGEEELAKPKNSLPELKAGSPSKGGRAEERDVPTSTHGGEQDESDSEGKKGQYRTSDDKTLTRSRSKLILPPIEPNKAMVSRT